MHNILYSVLKNINAPLDRGPKALSCNPLVLRASIKWRKLNGLTGPGEYFYMALIFTLCSLPGKKKPTCFPTNYCSLSLSSSRTYYTGGLKRPQLKRRWPKSETCTILRLLPSQWLNTYGNHIKKWSLCGYFLLWLGVNKKISNSIFNHEIEL